MPASSIDSNVRLDNTAVYYNGVQLGGIKEIFPDLDEEEIFDDFIQYEGTDSNLLNTLWKQL